MSSRAGLVCLDLAQRCPCDHGERGLAGGQVRQRARGEIVAGSRATRAARVPARVEYEVLHRQLATAAEHVEQARAAVRAVYQMLLVNAHHRPPAAVGVQRIPLAGEFLLGSGLSSKDGRNHRNSSEGR